MNETITIGIPAYNEKERIRYLFYDLYRQVKHEERVKEIIVNASGSTDGTELEINKISRELQDLRIKVIMRKERLGKASALNEILCEANGDIICFIDDDCIADRKWLEDLVRAFEERVGGVGGNIVCVKPRTLIEKYCERNIPLDTRRRDLSYIPTCNAAYLKSLIENEIDTSLRNYGDRALSLKVQSKGFLLKHISSAVVFYRYRSDLMKLMIQFYYYGRGHVQFNRKYRYKSNKQFIRDLLSLKKKIILKVPQVLCRLFTAIGKKDKLLFVAEPLIDILVYLSFLIGLVREILER